MIRAASCGLILFAAVAIGGCGSGLPLPKTGPHVGEVPIEVPTPPPPGKLEIIPARPKGMKDAVWVDGSWEWKGRRWVWQPGGFQEPLPGGYYAPPKTVRRSDGSLVFYPGAWKNPQPAGAPRPSQ